MLCLTIWLSNKLKICCEESLIELVYILRKKMCDYEVWSQHFIEATKENDVKDLEDFTV